MEATNIKTVCEKRLELITDLECGKLSKERFIDENYNLIKDMKRVNYNVTSIYEGIVKYHYFNTFAKKKVLEADIYEFREPMRYKQLKEEAYQYYLKKDRITLAMLEIVAYENVEAYFISLNSQGLCGHIFEVVLKDYDRVVLHSKDRKILHKLKINDCFDPLIRASVIDNYVNTKI